MKAEVVIVTPLTSPSEATFRRVPPCVARTYAVRNLFAHVAGELGAGDPRMCSKAP